MASPTSYGERPPVQGFRRSFTIPHKSLSLHERAGLDHSDADAEVLYSHASAKIFSFQPPTDNIDISSKNIPADTDYPVDAIETLPWRSRTESLSASGNMIIEKVKGSTNFLKAGSVMHAILKNSQCWCVDGESKFVLRVGKLRYYRIELPSATEEDKEKVEELKRVLPRVLRFERTPCPFIRAFHVDLPDDAITPRRRGTWKRRESSSPMTPDSASPSLRKSQNTRAWSVQLKPTSPLVRDLSSASHHRSSLSPGQTYGKREERPGTPSSLASSEDPESRYRDHSTDSRTSEEKTNQDSDIVDGQSQQDETGHQASSEKENAVETKSDVSINQEEQEAVKTGSVELQKPTQPISHGELEAQTMTESNLDPNQKDDYDIEQSERFKDENHQEEAVRTDVIIPEMNAEREIENVKDEHVVQNISPSSQSPHPDHELCDHNKSEAQEQSTHTEEEPISHAIQNEQERKDLDLEVENDLQKGEVDTHLVPVVDEVVPSNLSRVSSIDSFYTTDSLEQDGFTDQQASFADTETGMGILATKDHQHKRGLSDMTITALSTLNDGDSPITPNRADERAPALAYSSASDSSWPEVQTPASNIQDGLRQRLKSRRSFSPPPPSTTIFEPKEPEGIRITSAVLQKAAKIAIVKPIEVLVIVLHVITRIAGGATVNDLISGELFRPPNRHLRNSSFPDRISSHRDDAEDEDEDDFGMPIKGKVRSKETSLADKGDADSIFDLD